MKTRYFIKKCTQAGRISWWSKNFGTATDTSRNTKLNWLHHSEYFEQYLAKSQKLNESTEAGEIILISKCKQISLFTLLSVCIFPEMKKKKENSANEAEMTKKGFWGWREKCAYSTQRTALATYVRHCPCHIKCIFKTWY